MTEISDLLRVVSELQLGFEAVILRGPSMVAEFDVVKVHVLDVPDAEQFAVQDAITRKCIELLQGEADSWQVFIHGQGESPATKGIREEAEEIYMPGSMA